MELSKKEQEAIEPFEYWIEVEKKNRDKINKADELIKIRTTLLNLISKLQKENEKQSKVIDEMADKMLSRLGYMHMIETDENIVWILYGHEYKYEIDFMLKKKEVAYRVIERETDTIIDIDGMSMNELQAIIKKCEELGWLDE